MSDKPESSFLFLIKIRDLNERGQGVGTVRALRSLDEGEESQDRESPYAGKVCFVNGALPGEEVLARLLFEKRHYLVLDLVSILKPSPDRINSDCVYFPDCGGCQLRPMTYEAELQWKERRVRHFLNHEGLIEDDSSLLKPVIGMEDPYHYRGKSVFPIQSALAPGNPPLIGQYRQGTHELVDLDDCETHNKISLALVRTVRALISRDQVPLYDEGSHTGTLSHLLVRTGFSSKQIMIIFVVHDDRADEAIAGWIPTLEKTTNEEGGTLQAVWINDRETRGNRILSNRYRLIQGSPWIEEEINQVSYRISPGSFFQINPLQASLLFKEVIRAADLKAGDRVLDLYSGVGALSLQLAQAARDLTPAIEIIGVENDRQAVLDANLNADINELSNLSFIEADATSWLEDYGKDPDMKAFDVILVDPPRKGLDQRALEAIRQAAPDRFIYVSCNPSTLARDLSLLGDDYRLESAQPVDLFPRTTHVETMVLMSKSQG